MPQAEGQEGPAPEGDGSCLGFGGAGSSPGAEVPSGSVSRVFTASVVASSRAPGPLLGMHDSGVWGDGWTLFNRQGGVWDVGLRALAE